MLYLDAAMALQLVQNGSLSPKQATVLCLNHESLHTSTLITNLWAWFVGVASNMALGVWAWSVGVALVPEGSQKKLEPMDVDTQFQRDLATVTEMIHPHGWVVKDVPRDGDGMFSAVLRQVSGEHSHYTAETFRQAVVDHLRENPYRDAEHTCHYRDFLSDTVRTDDAYNA